MSAERIKVLVTPPTLPVDDSHSYYGGSIGNIAYNLLKSLSKFVDIHAFVMGYNLTRNLPANLKFYKFTNKFDQTVGHIKQAERIVEKEEISVIMQLYFFYGVSYNFFEKIKEYPFIIGMAELPHPLFDDEIGYIKRHMARFGKKFLFPLFRKTLEYCDQLIAVNDAAKELYSEFIPKEDIYVVPYGVDFERFKSSPLPTNRNILVVSRLIKRRNLDYLIEALPLILKDYPDTKLHFVGNGPRREILQRKAKELGVHSSVIFHGRVSGEELVNFYRNCYVYCHLSMADGWNQTALEAMASGRPVICTEAPHNSMVIDGKTGYKISALHPDVLAERILELFDNREMARKMGYNGRKEVEKKYNWDYIGKKYYEVCKAVLF